MSTRPETARTRLTLGPADDGRPLSAEEFADAIYEEPWTYERIDGRLVAMWPDGYGHVEASSPWLVRLILYQAGRPDVVEMVVPSAWVRVHEGTDRIGDLGVYLAAAPDGPKLPDRPPDLMFEIVSQGPKDRRRDYVEKRADYERAGVREYVIIDRFDRRVTVLELGPGGYRERVLSPGDVYETPLLPGLAVAIAEALGA